MINCPFCNIELAYSEEEYGRICLDCFKKGKVIIKAQLRDFKKAQ